MQAFSAQQVVSTDEVVRQSNGAVQLVDHEPLHPTTSAAVAQCVLRCSASDLMQDVRKDALDTVNLLETMECVGQNLRLECFSLSNALSWLQRSPSCDVIQHSPMPVLLRRSQSDSCVYEKTPLFHLVACEDADAEKFNGGECAICLGTGEEPPVQLHCGHSFCADCLRKHIAMEITARRTPWCPLCRCKLLTSEIQSFYPQAFSREDMNEDQAAPAAPPPPLSAREQRNFRRTARRQHLKKCPNCSAPIQKNGGCDHMNCTCGHRFNWSEAHTVVPCRRVHRKPNGFSLWGTTCPGCSKIAKAKLAGVRAGVVISAPVAATVALSLAVAGVATVAAGAALTAAVPAVVCAPLAAAYEPVRRIRGRTRRNPFYRGMGSGARLLSDGIEFLCDSD